MDETPLAQRVLDVLLEGINSGEIRPSERIVASRLCDQLGLSLAPVREALHVLAGQGVVELTRNRGARLRPMSHQDVLDFWPVIAAPAAVGIRLATANIGKHDNVERVMSELSKIKYSAEHATPFAFYASTNEYHYVLNEISENPFLGTLVNRYLVAYWERFLADWLPMRDFAQDYVSNYLRLTDAIVAGDAHSAESVWNYHVEWSIAILRGDPVEPGKHWMS